MFCCLRISLATTPDLSTHLHRGGHSLGQTPGLAVLKRSQLHEFNLDENSTYSQEPRKPRKAFLCSFHAQSAVSEL
jgi:hypothetical protein